ncbi:hypothetical protein BN1088_1431503 [Sphingobacterium sp. PM2-P1-29]|nr:hypothetical protein BN1088_1431503 [Sphingobacterium sp. PM2-P1-29]
MSENAKLNIRQTQGLEYKSVDNTLFVINKEGSSKGIKIYTGYVIQSIHKDKAVIKDCYVAEKDNFYAHGETVKKAIGDLNFKIVSEKLKNEPIEADTIITVNHYRLVTGACELGTKAWMEQNNIQVDSIRADELLLLLRKTHAYGLERFERLVNFEAEG